MSHRCQPLIFVLVVCGAFLSGPAQSSEPDATVNRTETPVSVPLLFNDLVTVSLENNLAFVAGEPLLNGESGWPQPGGSPQTLPAAAGSTETLPNLTPFQAAPSRPTLRKINTAQSIKIVSSFCSNLGPNEEKEVPVPPFYWGVINDARSSASGVFFVALLSGDTTVASERIFSLAASGRRIFTNWSGRPARVRVVNVTGAPLLAQYQNSTGCYLPNASAGTVRLDPKPLTIRVDSGAQIAERIETDNDRSFP